MKIGLVIPWREQPSRIKPLEAVLDWYKTNLSDIEIFYADRPGEKWNAAASRNDGVKRAQEAHCDVIIVNDADTIPEIKPLLEAIEECQKDNMIHNPYTQARIMNEEETAPYYEGKSLYWLQGTEHYLANGGIYVCTPKSWWLLGGQDEKFMGWGYEDSAFDRVHQIVHGQQIKKHPGIIYSLGHKRAVENEDFYVLNSANRDIYLKYYENHTVESMINLVKQKPNIQN